MEQPHLHIILGNGGTVEFWWDATEYLKWCFGDDVASIKVLLHRAEKENPLSIAVANSVRRQIINSIADGGEYDVSFVHCEKMNIVTKNGSTLAVGK